MSDDGVKHMELWLLQPVRAPNGIDAIECFTTRNASWKLRADGAYEVHLESEDGDKIEVNGVERSRLMHLYVIPAHMTYVRILNVDLDKHNAMMLARDAQPEAQS